MESKIDYSIHYSRWHDGTLDELRDSARFLEKWIGHELKKHDPSSRVLDYGCGFGSLVYYLSKYFHDVRGVDASKHQIEVARRNQLPVSLVAIEEFSTWCEANREHFDIIFMFDVLEHIPASDQIYFMRLLLLTLKPGGSIYIKVPNANSILASRWRYIDWTHTSSFTECSLDFVCLSSGLHQLEYLDDDSSTQPRYPYIPRLTTFRYWIKMAIRRFYKIYLWCELGSEAKDIRTGYNLFLHATKVDK